MRIIGIDPGYDILGWSMIDDSLKLINYGTITTNKDIPFDDRLLYIYNSLNEILRLYHPDAAAMEKLFFQKNTKTAMNVAKLIGVLHLTLKLATINCHEYTPSQVKLAITGYGRASKEQMQQMIMRLLHIPEIPKPDDAADALAIAVCHSCSTNIRVR